jgi:hypothetical protein
MFGNAHHAKKATTLMDLFVMIVKLNFAVNAQIKPYAQNALTDISLMNTL